MMGENFAQFEKWLGTENSSWHEYHLHFAAEELQKFSQEEWDRLLAAALSRPAWWQERCAEAVGEGEAGQGVPILLALLGSPYLLVMSIVASELDNKEVRVPARYEPRLLQLLRQLEEAASSRASDVRRLLTQLL
ncbi:hypothetical protein INH39_20910 [Massilia violaceinigra]|uniref:Uncharacterized protein n=1 Tax=Massilia violaceinigra TaxID=2045208 RepID=A0ABY3ZZM2_9BURK|nr:hypothetical protein [Massilia violaceinigra]UOD27933.1 hypothetical protein INH39_20910 [Massilia violaceinigra]